MKYVCFSAFGMNQEKYDYFSSKQTSQKNFLLALIKKNKHKWNKRYG